MPSFTFQRVALSLAITASAAACETEDESPEYLPDSGFVQDSGAVITTDSGVDASFGWDATVETDSSIVSDASVGEDAQADGGGGSDAGGSDAGANKLKPKCVKKDSQVMVIGDSYINWISHKFPEQLKTATQQNWRMLAIGGTAMGSGGIGKIPNQFYDSIKADPDAHTVLMDGGGNDILVADFGVDFFGDCKKPGSSMLPKCQMIVSDALAAADELMDKAVVAGIRDVVYFFYPYVPENRLIGGEKPNEILDYALPKVRDFCNNVEAKTNGKTRCHFIDMIPVFKGHTPGFDGVVAGSDVDWFNEDIHPNPKGSQGMVDAIWALMKSRCLGQKSGDCCEQ